MERVEYLAGHKHAVRLMRIFINGRFLTQLRTGVQRYALETLHALDDMLADGQLRERASFVLVTPGDALTPPLKHITVRKTAFLSGHLWEQITLPCITRGEYLINFNYSGPLIKRAQMITIHDASVAAVPESFSTQYRALHNALVQLLKNRVHTVMTVSAFSRHELARYFGVRQALVGVEGWQHAIASGDSAAVMEKFGLQPQNYLLAVGSIKPNKNFAVIDRALKLLGHFPMTVAIAGAKDISIFQHADAQGEKVRMLGFVSDEELGHLYRNASWFIFPSLYEGFGLPAIEAMGNGCPVIAANAASIPEVCGDAALYFDPHDAAALAALLQQTVSQPGLRDSMVARGKRQIEKFSWHDNARIIIDHLAPAKDRGLPVPRPDTQVIAAAKMLQPGRPHIVHVTESLAGGTLGFLVQAMHELHAIGVRQTLVYSRRPDSPENVASLFPATTEFRELPSARGAHLEFISGLRTTLREMMLASNAPDAVHLHSSKAGFIGRLLLAKAAGATRCFYSPHGLAFLNQRKRISSSIYLALERFAGSRTAFQPVGCGKSEAQLLEHMTKRSAFVLENPVPEVFFDVQRIASEVPVIVSAGKACEQKAPEAFANLAVKFHIKEQPARFVWVGSGEPQREALLRAADVTVTGLVDTDELRRHLGEALIYVQTSRWEGMPLAVIQAMAAGLPCVVTDVIGNRDAVTHGKTGLIARDENEIMAHVEYLLANPDVRLSMGRAAREDARLRFGRARFRQSLQQLYGLADAKEPSALLVP
jgi:glycosyltransferase involved in cell wall biosynthesis